MSRKRTDKKTARLEPDFRDILVCKKKDLRPNIEIFIQAPENISQQNLGTLAGIFEITDDSEESSYIVNYLISIIKKEYFSKTKRGSMESFEAALHKANLALSKLAEHETVGWINNINAVCLAIEKNNLHISQTGTAKAFLLRSKSLTDICDGQSEESGGLNPLKTFEDVISGRLDKNDKIILTTESIFDIFSLDEIKKSALKFNSDDFIQFLNTALINELDKSAVLVVDIKEEIEEPALDYASRKKAKINAFSQQTFIPPTKQEDQSGREERQEIVEEIKKELVKSQEGFVDKRTGHIYIRDDGGKRVSGQSWKYMEAIRSSASDLGENLIRTGKKIGLEAKKFITRALVRKKNNISNTETIHEAESIENTDEDIRKEAPAEPKTSFGEKISAAARKISAIVSRFAFYSRCFFVNRIARPTMLIASIAGKQSVRLSRFIASLIRDYKNRPKKEKPEPIAEETVTEIPPKIDYHKNPAAMAATRTEKLEWFNALSKNPRDNMPQAQEINAPNRKLIPDFSKLRAIFSQLDYAKRLYIITAAILLFIVPYFINKAQDRISENKKPETKAAEDIRLPLQDDINVKKITSLETALTEEKNSMVINVNGKIYAISGENITALEDDKKYPIPEEFQAPELAWEMDDLNLIFLLKDGKVLSFMANNKKFQPNIISFPVGADGISGKSYLTYVYILDAKNSQIYRYPRAEGGFGEKTDWIKDKADLSDTKDMAINENVFVTDGKEIFKFYRGKKQDFAVEKTATPLSIDKLYTKPDSENLYVLDKTNSRIVKLDRDGNILAQYYNAQIGKASGFTVDEEAQKIYISGESGVLSFEENQ